MNLAPTSATDLSVLLSEAYATRMPVASVDLRALNAVVEHTAEDMTATVQAGVPLALFQAVLARRGQWLPIDPPNPDTTTIGELLAENLSGPRRFGCGTIRESLIGLQVVLADGRVIRGGGKVVKNVAGYDLCKLFVASRGALGVIVEATFKLSPLPELEAFAQGAVATPAELAARLQAVLESDLSPVVLDAHNLDLTPFDGPAVRAAKSLTLVLGFAGAREDVVGQMARAEEMGFREPGNLEHARRFWAPGGGLVKRWSVLPSRLEDGITKLGGAPFVARAGNGLLCFRDGPEVPQPELPLDLMRRLKREFDPHEILPAFLP